MCYGPCVMTFRAAGGKEANGPNLRHRLSTQCEAAFIGPGTGRLLYVLLPPVLEGWHTRVT